MVILHFLEELSGNDRFSLMTILVAEDEKKLAQFTAKGLGEFAFSIGIDCGAGGNRV